ncbi:hypothetical protein [Armatimonas rosea]|uniref:DUF4350 domain-containing protein n=1 Tax=Armatimonas rosea TaxID=685828 RepID=A0A7W9SM93_ARMRO|nr:hypothetical protein [Armatimonas rosea]MBB6049241.1 hypothetical protein [Armatimonas rosea]
MRRLTLTALLGLSLLTVSTALAAGPDLSAKPRFGAALMPGYDQPVTVTVTNPADAGAFTGEVVLQRGQQSWRAPVSLPAGPSVATVDLRIYIPANSWYPTALSLRGSHGENKSIPWNPAVKPTNLLRVLVVTKDGNLPTEWEALNGQTRGVHRSLGYLAKAGPRRRPDEPYRGGQLPEEDYLSVVAASPTQLTDQAGDLDQFGIVVLSGELGLSEAQSAALRRWVNAGGTLIPLPAETDGPVEAVERLGVGRIRHVGLENPAPLLTSWNQVGALRAAQASDGDYYNQGSQNFFPQILQNSDVKAPPFSTIALFLGAYLFAVVPLQYIVLRRLDKREWAWGTTPLLAGVFAVGAYVVGSQGRSDTAFYTSAAVIETGSGQTTGNAVARYGLYSPHRTTYSLTAPTPDTTFFRTVGDVVNLATQQNTGQPPRLDEFSVPQWAMRSVAFQSKDLPLGGGIVADLKEVRGMLTGTITNNTPVVLESVTLHRYGMVGRVETIAPGQTVTVQSAEMPWRSTTGLEPERRYYSMLTENNLRSWGSKTEVVITALTPQDLVPLQLGGGKAVAKTTNSLLIVHAPLK